MGYSRSIIETDICVVGYVAPDILFAGVNEPYDINVDIFSVSSLCYWC